MKKTIKTAGVFLLICLLTGANKNFAQKPTILINSNHTLASSEAKFPYWLASGNTLDKGNKVFAVSVIQYDITLNPAGNKELNFDTVLYISSSSVVPVGKTWKVESAILDTTIVVSSGGGVGDNWGGQSVVTDATLTGIGTAASQLSIAQQSAGNGQTLKWDGTTWLPYEVPAYAASTGSANAYIVSLTPAATAYNTGMLVYFKANFSNTGASTIDVNGLGATAIKRNYNQDLSADDIRTDQMVMLMYDGTYFQMLGQIGTAPAASSPASYGFSSAGGLYYKIINAHGYLTSYLGAGVNNFAWRLANQSEISTLIGAGIIQNGWNGWSGDGYPGQEAGYQYYWQNNSGTLNWHQSDWGNGSYARTVLIWVL